MYSLMLTIFSYQFKVFNVEFIIYSVQCTIYIEQCTDYSAHIEVHSQPRDVAWVLYAQQRLYQV